MINVLIADDQAIIRKGLREIISGEKEIRVAGEAKSSEETLHAIQANRYDILILDINMTGRSGLDILPDIKSLSPLLPVLVLSINPEEHYAMRCFKAGASGYMNKDIEPEELLLAIRKIASGDKYFSSSFTTRLLIELEAGSKTKTEMPHNKLSAREFEVLRMLAQGKSPTEISRLLSLSIKTVSTYKSRIQQKLDLSSPEQVVEYARKYIL